MGYYVEFMIHCSGLCCCFSLMNDCPSNVIHPCACIMSFFLCYLAYSLLCIHQNCTILIAQCTHSRNMLIRTTAFTVQFWSLIMSLIFLYFFIFKQHVMLFYTSQSYLPNVDYILTLIVKIFVRDNLLLLLLFMVSV